MKVNVMTAIGAALAIALSAYGFTQSFSPAGAPAASFDYDDHVLQQIGTTPAQLKRYRALRKHISAESQKMYKLPYEEMRPRGLEINRELRKGLQEIFSKKQYDQYCYLWSDEPFRKKQSGATAPRKMPNWGRTEEQILASLNLSERQKREVATLQKQLEKENQELRELWRTADGSGTGIGEKSAEINRHQNEGMKRILTPAQHASYLRQWKEVMAPFTGNVNPYRVFRPVGRGNGKKLTP